MERKTALFDTSDLDIKISLGNIILNILFITYESPRPSWAYSNHYHSSYELHFIPFGNGQLHVMGNTFKIEPGTFYITGPGIFHEQKADNIDPMCEYCINFEVNILKKKNNKTELYIQNEIDEILNIILNTNFWFGKDVFSSVNLFTDIIFNLENRMLGYYSYIQNLVSLVILNALRCFANYKKTNYSIPSKILNDSRRAIIDDYFFYSNQPLNREELAKKIGTSIRQLNRSMKEYYGLSFKEKLIYDRLEQAKKLLLYTDLTINEIASKTGFSSQSYFTKVFKNHVKASPAKFRQEKKALMPLSLL
jgi:AraC-like DNA-binding protein